MNPTEAAALKSELSHFTGTEAYHRWTVLSNDVLTDGAKYLAEKAGMFWLMDIVGSVRTKILKEGFATVALTLTPNGGGVVLIDDGNGRVIHRQGIPYTDAPFPQKLFVQPCDENRLCIMLPSEY